MTAFAAGGYRYIPAVFQYSGGVAAEPGFAVVRVRFHRPVPLAQGFARIEQVIREAGRPLTAFCACELRSPAPFTEEGFRAFNEVYAGTLRQWGVMQGDANPVARSNVCPEIDPPPEPSFHAFCFTVAAKAPLPTFVVAGSGEAVKRARATTAITRCASARPRRTRSREKARFVLSARWSGGSRCSALPGPTRPPPKSTRCTTCTPSSPTRSYGAARACAGLTWHYARPPVRDLEYEMDCRAIAEERVI